jgi:hypothetical protein
MIPSQKKSFLLIWSVLAVLISCSKENDTDPVVTDGEIIITEKGNPTGIPVEESIGPDGGTITSSDGLLRLSVPAGALESTASVSIVPITNEAPLGLGLGYRLEPEGIDFKEPITLTFHYSDEMLGSTSEDFLWIVFQEKDNSWKAMLKSTVDTDEKTITVETTHFSDWMVGRFIDLSLDPPATTVKKGGKVILIANGFFKSSTMKEEDELAPLIALPEIEDDLAPLPILVPFEKRYVDYRIKGWTLNGSAAPVSNNYGSLKVSKKNIATYTAPSAVPEPNPVVVSVQIETSDKQGKNSAFYLTSNILILESDLFLTVTFDGKTFTYIQHGFDGTSIDDPMNYTLANCGLEDHLLSFSGGTIANGNMTDGIVIVFENPSIGSRGLIGSADGGKDDVSFGGSEYPLGISMLNEIRTGDPEYCQLERDESYHVFITLTEYTGQTMSILEGSFNGTLYHSESNYDEICKSSDSHTISGNFRLIIAAAI